MHISASQTLAELATTLPAASRVFQRHRLDFCCHGDRPLREACRAAQLDPEQIVNEIVGATNGAAPAVKWDERPLEELIDYILERYHVPLHPELDRIDALASKVTQVHGSEYPALRELAERVRELTTELRLHLSKEENVLFPWIRNGRRRVELAPIQVMHAEHEAAGAALDELRRLTDDFSTPPGACASWVALYVRLDELDRELRDHLHLENNILFPRALGE